MFDDYLLQCYARELCKDVATRVIQTLKVTPCQQVSAPDDSTHSYPNAWEQFCAIARSTHSKAAVHPCADLIREIIRKFIYEIDAQERQTLYEVLGDWLRGEGKPWTGSPETNTIDYILLENIINVADQPEDPEFAAYRVREKRKF